MIPHQDYPAPLNPVGAGELLKSAATGDVVILGAGFSRAISDHMPITDELGNLAMAEAGFVADSPFGGGRFESWLSTLAEPQPYLSPADNATNLGKFHRLVEAIHSVMTSAEAAAVQAGLPDWLGRFVASLHARRATVISFNYDRLVERGLHELGLHDFDNPQGAEPIQWFDALDELPPLPASSTWLGGSPHATLRLLKLHGSLNWYWVPGDFSGVTLNRWELDDDDQGRSRYLPGREPFIVPPAALKSAYFRNPIVSEIWRRAAVALRNATSVSLIGYSMPLTDLVSSGMIYETLSRDGVGIAVVNPDAKSVAASVRRVTGQEAQEFRSVETFVETFVDDTSRGLVNQCLGMIDNASRVLIGWRSDLMAAARSVARVDGGVEVAVDATDAYPPGNPVSYPSNAILMADLVSELRPGDTLTAVFVNGKRSRIVGIDGFRWSQDGSLWQVFIPADGPASLKLQNWQQANGLGRT